MATKKAVKVRDMKPKKDAKGGGGASANRRGHSVNSTGTNGGAANRHGHGHGNN